jgi:hypothetical protein
MTVFLWLALGQGVPATQNALTKYTVLVRSGKLVPTAVLALIRVLAHCVEVRN